MFHYLIFINDLVIIIPLSLLNLDDLVLCVQIDDFLLWTLVS